MGIKVVPIGYISYKKEIDQLRDDHVSIIYRPLTFTKITQALGGLFDRKTENATAATSDSMEADIAGLRILVAEDNEINQNLIKTVLSNFQLEISIANDGKEALELRKNNEYDLIMMDIQMPVMGGIEATEAILEYEKEQETNHVPIVALTANALQGDREKYLRAGMDDYISKPIKIDQVRQVIQEHCHVKLKKASPLPREDVASVERRVEVSSPIEEPPAESRHDVPEDSPETREISSAEEMTHSILLYCRSGLIQSIHEHVLSKEGYRVDVAETEEAFFKMFESHAYQYVLLDSKLIPQDNCVMTDVIRESGVVPLIYALEKTHICADHVEAYSRIEALREKLVS
jgi:CheY-like chemotaxis protein